MKAVIQAGGRGTRLTSITKDLIPKPMIEIDGKPILEHQINNLKEYGITDIILVIGHLGNVIEEYFKDGARFGVNISYYREDPNKLLGTAGALYYLKETMNDDFIFLLADVFINIDFDRMIKFHRDKNAVITLFTHPNAHPYDSDIIIEEKNIVKKFDYKTNDRSNYDYKNIVNAGIMIFNKDVLNLLKEPKKYDYEKDLIRPLIETNRVYSYMSSEYAKDTGTPERYNLVKKDHENGICEQKNLKHLQKAIFLDRDGTIIKYIPFLNKKEQVELIPNAAEAIKEINNSGYLCIIVTNQPIIARGESTVENLNEIHKRLEVLLGQNGAYIDRIYYCPHHPDKGFEGEIKELKIDCDCRKPKIGMLEKAKKDFNIDFNESYIIGDSTLDVKTGINAGIKTILVKTGQAGEDKKYDVTADFIENDIYAAVKKILRK